MENEANVMGHARLFPEQVAAVKEQEFSILDIVSLVNDEYRIVSPHHSGRVDSESVANYLCKVIALRQYRGEAVIPEIGKPGSAGGDIIRNHFLKRMSAIEAFIKVWLEKTSIPIEQAELVETRRTEGDTVTTTFHLQRLSAPGAGLAIYDLPNPEKSCFPIKGKTDGQEP